MKDLATETQAGEIRKKAAEESVAFSRQLLVGIAALLTFAAALSKTGHLFAPWLLAFGLFLSLAATLLSFWANIKYLRGLAIHDNRDRVFLYHRTFSAIMLEQLQITVYLQFLLTIAAAILLLLPTIGTALWGTGCL